LQSIVPPGQSGANGGSASNPTASTSYSSALAASMAQQQSKHAQSQVQIPTAADISLLLSLGLGGLDASQLANLDLQKLAMYLVSIHFEIRNKYSNLFFLINFFPNSTKTQIFFA
jgi:chromodomain-helicase-DNA-binding protein 7